MTTLDPANIDFVITRVLNASRPLVFKAWTDPRHMSRWWGPRGFECTCEIDARPSGKYRLVMHGPDGTQYPITGAFREIVAPERIVMTMDPSEHPPAWHDMIKPNRGPDEPNPAGILLTTVTFEDLGLQTKLTIRSHFESSEISQSMLKLGMYEGWSSSLDKLVELLPRL